jgi:hypothetical protein
MFFLRITWTRYQLTRAVWARPRGPKVHKFLKGLQVYFTKKTRCKTKLDAQKSTY